MRVNVLGSIKYIMIIDLHIAVTTPFVSTVIRYFKSVMIDITLKVQNNFFLMYYSKH